MKKTLLQMEQIVAGALLKNFDTISSLDLALLSKNFTTNNPGYELSDFSLNTLNKYLDIKDYKVMLKNGLTLPTLKKELETVAGPHVIKYFSSFDTKKYVLRKIGYNQFSNYDLDRLFCESQLEEIKKLEKEGIIRSFSENNYIVTELSNYGKLELFKLEHSDEIQKFKNELDYLKYDTKIIDNFLLAQDLSLPTEDILTIDNMDNYLKNSNIPNSIFPVNFTKINLEDPESEKDIDKLLTIYDDSNFLYICHPNNIFKSEETFTEIAKNKGNINWNNIDLNKLFETNNYDVCTNNQNVNDRVFCHFYYYMPDEIRKYNDEGDFAFYHAIVEKYKYNNEDNFIVRGVLKEDKDGYYIAFNPEYEQAISQFLSQTTNEKPNIYHITRKK